MKSYSTFIFDSYAFDPQKGQIELRYSLDNEIHFMETVRIPVAAIRQSLRRGFRTAATEEKINAALFVLHLIGGISYYKTCCPKTIEVRSGVLTKEQAEFWNTVYEKGLGEFWYKNGMDGRGMVRFPVSILRDAPPCHGEERSVSNHHGGGAPQDDTEKRILIPIGGGKDSIVTLEMLRQKGNVPLPPLPTPPPEGEGNPGITLFRMGSHPVIDEIAKIAGLPLITIERTLDPQLFDLNKNGALNGHIPITGYLSCLCTVIAKLYGFNAIAMSCEKSASEGNIEYRGEVINHQWSKSEEFETMFQEYIRTSIDPNLKYWSPIRHMTELEIVKEFAKYPQYWTHTTSCNKNWKITPHPRRDAADIKNVDIKTQPHLLAGADLWCNSCPKCAFVFSLYAAYLPKEKVLEIFGKNLFEEEQLIPTYRQLLGLEGFKPFECVGTPEETREAFALAEQNDFTLPIHAHS